MIVEWMGRQALAGEKGKNERNRAEKAQSKKRPSLLLASHNQQPLQV